jgi:recombinational DNA repair protein RecR
MLRAIAVEVLKSRSVHLINFCGGGQVIALKSATALILGRYLQAEKNDRMRTIMTLIKNTIRNYTGDCPKCGAYYLDDEEVCQICGWPYTD